MYKNILHSVLFIVLSVHLHAQTNDHKKKAGSIAGTVVDGNLGEALPFVTVFVKQSDSEEILTGQITDESGAFEIKGIPTGEHQLEIQFVGFKNVSIAVVISKESPRADVGQVLMYDDVEMLNTVEVTAERSTIEQKVDRKVINIGKDLATAGPTAADLMVNLPSVDVDQDGTVSLRGNDEVIVLVDGKPTNQSSAQLLQQIPSGSIERIELITNPSAKYVPEGMSGIINIILRKNTNIGFNGTVNGGFTSGERQRYNGALDLNYRTKKLNLFFNASTSDGPMPTWGTIDRAEDDSYEVWYSLNDRTSYMIKSGFDLDVSSKTVVSAYTLLNWFENQGYRSTDIFYPNAEVTGSLDFGQEYSTSISNTTNTYNFDITHQFENNASLEFEADHSIFDGNEAADFEFYGSIFPVEEAIELIGNTRKNTTLNLDYEKNLSSTKRLQIGAEARLQRTNNTYETTNPNFANSAYDLNRDILATYFNMSHKLGKWSYQLGARLEIFDQNSLFREEDSEGERYDDLIRSIYPSAFISYVPNPETQKDAFNFSVSRRVDRPNITQLNPMRAWSSARITNVGNPALIPQFTNSAEINYTRQLSSGSITSAVFYRMIMDEITRFGFNDAENPGNILFSYDNYQNNSAYGMEISGNYQFTPIWSGSLSFDLYSQTQKGVANDVSLTVENKIYNIRTNHSFKAGKKLTFQLIGLYRSANTNLQYTTRSMYFVNTGARLKTFKGKGTLSLNVNDIFHTQRFAFFGERPVSQEGNYNWDSQSVFIGYSHVFGKGKKRQLKRKKRDNNEKKSTGGF